MLQNNQKIENARARFDGVENRALYEIDVAVMSAINAVYSKVDPETGELLDASAVDDLTALDALKMERKTKIENILCYVKNLTADADAIEAEAKKLNDRAKQKRNRADSLVNYVARSMINNAETKFEGIRAAAAFRSSKRVEIPDETLIPHAYCNKSITYKPDKKAIKAAIESGKRVRGALIVEHQKLNIK